MHTSKSKTLTTNDFDSWAKIYDKVYEKLQHDIPFYLQQAIASGGPILELGCGTGRISIPLAAHGFEVVGIDLSSEMIARANLKAHEMGLLSKLNFFQADMRTLSLNQKFNLIIIPFRSLMLLNTQADQQNAILTAAKHLMNGGKLIFDLFNPTPELLEDNDPEPFVESEFSISCGGYIKVHASNKWDYKKQLSMPNLQIEEFDDLGNLSSTYYHKLKMRYLYIDETTKMLARAGFGVDVLYGGFDGQTFDNDSEDQVWVCMFTK